MIRYGWLRAMVVAAVTTVLVCMLPILASAQESTAPTGSQSASPSLVAPPDAPLLSLENLLLQAQVWPEAEPGRTVVIVGATLPTDTVLPVRIQVPVPAGSELVWAGEITGGGPETDIQRQAAIVDVAAGQAVEMVLEESLAFQYEVFTAPPVIEGDQTVTTFTWMQSLPTAGLSVAWRIPAGTGDVELTPEAPDAPQSNQSGERLYTLRGVAPQVGDELTFVAAYGRAGAPASEGSGIGLVPVLLGLLALAVIALLMAVSMQRNRAVEIDHMDEDE